MATLKESIQAEITSLQADKAAIEAKITAAEAHLTAFGPWLESELSAAEGEIKSFFDKFRTPTQG